MGLREDIEALHERWHDDAYEIEEWPGLKRARAQLADLLTRHTPDPERTVEARFALGLWERTPGEWASYGEGWHTGPEKSGFGDQRDSAEDTIIDNALNEGHPIHWRYVTARVPLPDEPAEVAGEVVDE